MKKLKTYIPLLQLLVISIGMHAQNYPPGFILTNDSIQLEEVVITGTVPLNDRQIESLYKTNTLSTIDNIIERLDGLSLIRRGSYAMEPALNGFSGGQVNLTIDGMKMFGACTDRMDPITSYIEPSNLKSITVFHGSGAGRTGSSTGGSVDMALQEPEMTSDRLFKGSLSLGHESASNGKTVLFSTGYSKNKWLWNLNSAYRNHDSYKDGSGETVPFTQYEKANFHSVLKYVPDSSSSIKADVLFDLAHNVGYASLPMDVSEARAILAAVEYRSTRHKAVTAKAYFNTIFHNMDDSKRDSTFYVTNSVNGKREIVYMHMDMPGFSTTYGAYGRTVINLSANHLLTLQADNYTNHSLAEMTMHMRYPEQMPESPMYLQTWPDMIRNVTGLFIEDTWLAARKLRLTLGGRLDYNISMPRSAKAKEQFSVFGIDVSKSYRALAKAGSLSLQYMHSKHMSLKLETGYSERIPTISEQFGFYLYNAKDGYDYIGNPDIKSEKSEFVRIVAQYAKPVVRLNFSQSLYLIQRYIMGITDVNIPPMNFNTNGTRIYENLPGAKVYSANLQVQYTPLEALSFILLTKYTHGQLNSGDPLPLIAPLNNVLAINFQHYGWSGNLENETALTQKCINTGYGEVASPAYTVFNIKISRHFMFLNPVMFDCSLAVSNVLNAKYYKHLDWGQIYRPGRSLDILLRFKF